MALRGYDEKTEILTNRGFTRLADLWPTGCGCSNAHIDTEIGCWDPKLGSLIYEEPILHREVHCGPMYHVKSQQVDLLVAPEHKIFASVLRYMDEEDTMFWVEPILLSAKWLSNRNMVRYYKAAPHHIGTAFDPAICGLPVNAADLILQFCGFFIGCGHFVSDHTVGFNIKNRRRVRFLTELCTKLGWSHRAVDGIWSVQAFGLGQACASLFCQKGCSRVSSTRYKRIPFNWSLLKPDAKMLLTGIQRADNAPSKEPWIYRVANKRLAGDVERLILHAGLASNSFVSSENDKELYAVHMLDQSHMPIVNQYINAQGHNQVSTDTYEGNVFYTETRTNIVMVRRNGKIVLCGN